MSPLNRQGGTSDPDWPTTVTGRGILSVSVFLLLYTVVFFRSPLLEQKVFYVWDLGVLYLPVHIYNARVRAEGEIPLWNRHGFLGYPTQAENEVSGIYPPSVIFNLIEDSGAAYTAFIVFHFFVALASMIYLLRVLKVRPIGQAAAALVFAYGGSFVSYTHGLPWITTFAWAPLVLGLQLRAFERRSYVPAALAGIVFAVQIIGCHPQPMFYVALVMLAAALCEFRGSDRWARLGWAIKSSAVIALVGFCLSAPQVFYLMELMSHTVRWSGLEKGMPADRSLPPQFLIQAIIPNFLGYEPRNYLYFFEMRFYFGMLSLGLMILAWNSPCKRARLFWIVMIASVVLMLGNYAGVYPLISRLPGFRQIHSPQRFVIVMSLAGAALVGLGCDRLVSGGLESVRLRRWLSRGYGVIAALALTCGLLVLVTGEEVLPDYKRMISFGTRTTFPVDQAMLTGFGRAAVGAALLAMLCAMFWYALGRRSFQRYAGPVALCLIALDLLVSNGAVNQYEHPGFYSEVPRTVEFLRKDPGLWRIVSIRGSQLDYLDAKLDRLPANASAPYGIDALNYHAGAQHERIIRHFGDSFSVGETSTIKELGIFNVKYLLVPYEIPELAAYEKLRDDGRILYENPAFQPRVAVRENYVVIAEETDIKPLLNSDAFDHRQSVVIGRWPVFRPGEPLDHPPEDPIARVTHYGPHRIVIEAELPREGILVLNDLHYPGWRATTNGREVEILLANGFVRGLSLGPGRHHVEFTYHPRSFYAGVRVSLAMLAILGICGLLSIVRAVRRRSGPSPNANQDLL